MRVAVIANGEWDVLWGSSELEAQRMDLIICADGGANHALASGIMPDVLIGDLDSITEENLVKCQSGHTKIKKYPREKDQTDLELAMEYAEEALRSYGQPGDEIILYGAGGKRVDHLLGNIALMLGWAQKARKIMMAAKDFQAWVSLPGTEVITGNLGQELSILALSEQARVTSRGLYYELDNLTLHQNSARGISNVLSQKDVQIEVHEGIILIICLKNER